MRIFRGSRLIFAGVAGWALLGDAQAASFEFVPAPQTNLNRLYRVDRVTGEVTSCQYGLQENEANSVGATLCFGAGEGAGPQTPAEYGLVASRHQQEGGVFRVNLRTGEMSVCYVYEDKVVCTPQTNPPPAGTAGASTGANAGGPTPTRRP